MRAAQAVELALRRTLPDAAVKNLDVLTLTNAAFRRPANLFPLRFGNDSFKPHHAAAQATGQPCVVLNLPGIAVDVDNPEDLQHLISLPGNTRAQQLAREYVRMGKMPSPV